MHKPAVLCGTVPVLAMRRYIYDVPGVKLLGDREMWTQFGQAARAAAVSRYSAALIVPMYEQFYEEVLARPGA